MKKSIISLLCFAVAATGMTSCDGLEMSHNGKLEGYWHVVEFDTLATGGVCNMSEGTLFLGVQMHLMSFYDSSSKVANLFSHFEMISSETIGRGETIVKPTSVRRGCMALTI